MDDTVLVLQIISVVAALAGYAVGYIIGYFYGRKS